MSFLKNWTHDGGETFPDEGTKAKELGLMEKIDRLLAEEAPDPVAAFVNRANRDLDGAAGAGPIKGDAGLGPAPKAEHDIDARPKRPAPSCKTCNHG